MMRTRVAVVAVAVALGLSACGGGSSSSSSSSGPKGTAAKVDPAECGLSEFASAKKPVEVKFWHTQARANNDWLIAQIKKFNAQQSDVHVTLTQFPSYQDLLTKYLAGLTTGDLPDLFQPEDTTVQKLIDSKSVVPVQACIDADKYPTSDFLPRALAYYSYQDVLYGMPWTVSNPILWYNRTAFTKAGLDPDKPPTTLEEVKAYSKKIVDSGASKHGLALRIEPYIFEFLNAKSGSTYVNNGNGRDARSTAATLQTDTATKIWTWWNDMVKSGLAINTGGATGNIDHMLAIGNNDAAMTMEASGVLGTVKQILESGQYSTVKIATAPLPSLNGGGGVPVGDGSLWIPKHSSPAQRAAAWQVIKYLSSTEMQASAAIEGGYAPIRTSATEVPALKAKWAAEPWFKTAYTQLTTGTEGPATAGSLIGDYQGVRDSVKDGITSMLSGGLTPQQALQKAQSEADTAISNYNDRVSG